MVLKAIGIILLLPSLCWGAASLAWDPNPIEEGVVAYQIYEEYEESAGSGTFVFIEVGEVTGTEYVLGETIPFKCWRVTASNSSGLRSEYSARACESNLTSPPVLGSSPPSKPSQLVIRLVP